MENHIPSLSVLQSALLFYVWKNLGEDADSPTVPDYQILAEKYGRGTASFRQTMENIWIKGAVERIPMKRQGGRSHFGYFKSSQTSIEIKGWGVYNLGEQVPSSLQQAQEDALYDIKVPRKYPHANMR